MTEKNFCNCMGKCSGECHYCPFDKTISLDKDLSASRNRHHAETREKKRILENATILHSKANKLLPQEIWEKWLNGNETIVLNYSLAYLATAKAAWQRAIRAEKAAARLS